MMNLLQDAHAKKQKEIRDLMKKRREKAVLVDRISRWLFPTSFILLNIVYWALFGDHDLWWAWLWPMVSLTMTNGEPDYGEQRAIFS